VEWTASIQTISLFKRHPGRQSRRSDRKARLQKILLQLSSKQVYHLILYKNKIAVPGRANCVSYALKLYTKGYVWRGEICHTAWGGSLFFPDTCEENRTHRGRRWVWNPSTRPLCVWFILKRGTPFTRTHTHTHTEGVMGWWRSLSWTHTHNSFKHNFGCIT